MVGGAGLDVGTGDGWDIGFNRIVDRGWGAAYLGMKMGLSRRCAMSGVSDNYAVRNSLLMLVVGLCAAGFGSAAWGQSATGAAASGAAPTQSQSTAAAKPAAGAATQTAGSGAQNTAQSAGQNSAQVEPKMEDQSAPAAESLGEAARRARAQKAKSGTAKVYSDDSVSNLSGHGVSVVGDGQAGGGASDAGSAGGGAGASGGSGAAGGAGAAAGEQYWRGRANAIRSQMAQCDQKISEIQDEIAKHGAVTVDPMSGAQAGVIFVEDRNAQIKQVEHQKEGLQSQLDELAEEGRKAGADSGWFR